MKALRVLGPSGAAELYIRVGLLGRANRTFDVPVVVYRIMDVAAYDLLD
jgi:hypothetical protein